MHLVRILFLSLLLTGCVSRRVVVDEGGPYLSSIHIVDQEGFSQVITQKDRLRSFSDVDIHSPQPYQKMLSIFQRDIRGKIRALLTTYYPSGQIRNYLEIEDNRAQGRYLEWSENGNLLVSATILGGEADITDAAKKTWLFDGIAKAWNEDGYLVAEIEYSKGLQNGPSTYYHPNGNVWKRFFYHDNVLSGNVEYFFPNGQLLSSMTYLSGNKDGLAERFYPCGDIASREQFKEGILLSGEYFKENGELISSVEKGKGQRAVFGKRGLVELQEISDGVPDGKVSFFSDDGSLVKEYHIKKFQKDGEEIFYSHNKKPRAMINWREGKIHGVVKTWYDTGELESEREMSANLKNGHLFAWYRDGGIMLVETYENDKLIEGKYYRPHEDHPVSEVRDGKGTATLFDDNGRFLQRINYISGSPEDQI